MLTIQLVNYTTVSVTIIVVKTVSNTTLLEYPIVELNNIVLLVLSTICYTTLVTLTAVLLSTVILTIVATITLIPPNPPSLIEAKIIIFFNNFSHNHNFFKNLSTPVDIKPPRDDRISL